MAAKRAPIPDRRRQHFAAATRVRLDERTRSVGLTGVAAARAELARHPGPAPQAQPSEPRLRDPSLRPVRRARVRSPQPRSGNTD